MGRNKAIESKVIIDLANDYRLENPNSKITFSKLGVFARDRGYDVQDYSLRRDVKLREYLDIINSKSEENLYNELVTYKTIDADAFIARNRTRDELKEALINRDKYYAKIASCAVEAIKSVKPLKEENQKLKKQNEELMERMKTVQASKDKAEIREKDEAIKKLKDLLDSYVYPDVANMLIEKSGIGEVVNSTINKDSLKEKTIDAGTSVNRFLHDSVNKLVGGFDE